MTKILQGVYDRGYCIIRPPGHHASSSQSSGFCFFNNAAIAANVALSPPFNLERVAIFDWDIHHGDGTQSFFYESNCVLYMSLHRTDKLTFYPNNVECRAEYIGEGIGKGFNVNVAWETGKQCDEMNRLNNERTELGNNEYKYACDKLLLPILKEY